MDPALSRQRFVFFQGKRSRASHPAEIIDLSTEKFFREAPGILLPGSIFLDEEKGAT
jgi:hypothetical protein